MAKDELKTRNPLELKRQHLDELMGAVPEPMRDGNTNYIIATLENAMQDPVDMSDPKMIEARIGDYFKNCIEYGLKPHLPGFALALGMDVNTLKGLFTNRMVPKESLSVIQKGIAMVESMFISNMLDQRIHPATAIFMCKNWFDYSDASDITIHRQQNDTQDTKAIENKYKSVVDMDDEDNVIDVKDAKVVSNGKN